MAQKTNKTALAFEQLEQGLAELLESGDWQRYLKTQSQFHNYSFPYVAGWQQGENALENFYLRRLTEVCHDPQQVWKLTKDPTNIFRLNEQEINDLLTELNRRVSVGEIDPQVRNKIIQGINYQ